MSMDRSNPTLPIRPAGGTAAYAAKSADYFAGARQDWLDRLPPSRTVSILELGCGSGNTGASALALGKCARYCGIEISAGPAAIAREVLSEVVVGDVEAIELPWADQSFDILLMSEVLEHLVNPWNALRKLHRLVKPGARVMASSPNVSHYRIVQQLLTGRWDLTDAGAMDRTHLRWFTPASYGKLFEDCGYVVDQVGSVQPLTRKARVLCALAGGRGAHIFTYQIDLQAHRAET